jgi:catechol 2,3-dioxygenase-like lactoylglutathione lyase family enzyme
MDTLTAFGLFAVAAMLVFYTLENRKPAYVLAFAGACALGSVYGFLQGAWPFGIVEAIWSGVAVRRWSLRRNASIMATRGVETMHSFEITGIDHVVVRSADQARALAFYRDILGLIVEREQPEIGLIQLRAGRSLIDLIPGDAVDQERRNIDHFALEIRPFDESALRTYLAARGVSIVEAGLRYGAGGEGPSLYVLDPDGNKVELKAAP